MKLDELRNFFIRLSNIAAAETLPFFRSELSVEDKADDGTFDPVTKIDRQTEMALVAEILKQYPGHSILGEETGLKEGVEPWTWIIDPIDGTRSYISGLPTWGTLVGLLFEGVPKFGMMSQPYVKDCFIGGDGGATLIRPDSSSTLGVRPYRAINEATVLSTAPEMFKDVREKTAFARLCSKVNLTRFGADCYGYCLLAAGCIDLVVEADLQFHDIAPLIPILESAGGVISDWDGNPVRSGGRVVAASSERLLAETLILLGEEN